MEQKYELYHHGILGMHWGIRRFQNDDGTLTPAGKKRYQEGSSFGSKGREVRAKDAAELKRNISEYREMGDKETADLLDKHYKNLIKDLDEREIRFAENYLKIKLAQNENWANANKWNAVERGVAGLTGGKFTGRTGAIAYQQGRNEINDRYAKEIAENKELARQIKEGRRNQKKEVRERRFSVVKNAFKEEHPYLFKDSTSSSRLPKLEEYDRKTVNQAIKEFEDAVGRKPNLNSFEDDAKLRYILKMKGRGW